MTDSEPKYVRRPFPTHSLSEALRIAQAIQDHHNGRPMNRVLLANAIQKKPASSDFKALLSSSLKYGLTKGTEKSESISLTELGGAITKPRDDQERAAAVRRATLHPELLRRVYEHYNNGKLPQGSFFLNVLERDFAVPRERCQECAELVADNGRFSGVVQELQGSMYVIIDAAGSEALPEQTVSEDVGEEEDPPLPVNIQALKPEAQTEPPTERYIFVAHGKNKRPLDQLLKVLEQFGIHPRVAVNEPQMARPISEKVAQTMRECHSAIFIFTGDEEFRTPQGDPVWHPNLNVTFELGAASVLYGNRIVIFKEEGVEFPTDFRDIGYISFEKDRLDTKGADLIKELIALGLVKIQAA